MEVVPSPNCQNQMVGELVVWSVNWVGALNNGFGLTVKLATVMLQAALTLEAIIITLVALSAITSQPVRLQIHMQKQLSLLALAV